MGKQSPPVASVTGVGCLLIVLPEVWGWSRGEKGGVAITTRLCNQYKWPGQLKVPFGVGMVCPTVALTLSAGQAPSSCGCFQDKYQEVLGTQGGFLAVLLQCLQFRVPHNDHLLEPGDQAGFPLTSINVFRLPGYKALPGGDCAP